MAEREQTLGDLSDGPHALRLLNELGERVFIGVEVCDGMVLAATMELERRRDLRGALMYYGLQRAAVERFLRRGVPFVEVVWP